MSQTVTVSFTREVGETETEYLIDVTCSEGQRGCMYTRGGDPGWPDEQPEAEADEATIRLADKAETPVKLELTQDEIDKIEEEALEIAGQNEPDYD